MFVCVLENVFIIAVHSFPLTAEGFLAIGVYFFTAPSGAARFSE